jgi:Zn-dependent metalloprotease
MYFSPFNFSFMKKFIFAFLLMLCHYISIGQEVFQSHKIGNDYIFNDETKILKSDLFTEHKTALGLSEFDDMVLLEQEYVKVDSTDTLDRGGVYARYQQYYKGYPVEFKALTVFSRCEIVSQVSGSIVEGLDISDNVIISEEEALDAAMSFLNADNYRWLVPAYENAHKAKEDDPNATLKPVGTLLISKKLDPEEEDAAENYALCWKFNVPILDTVNVDSTTIDSLNSTIAVYVNANNGTIHTSLDFGQDGFFVQGSLQTWYYGYMTDAIHTGTCTFCSYYQLEDYRGIETTRGDNLLEDGNNNWINGDQKTGASAHWAVERAYDYFLHRLGRGKSQETQIRVDEKGLPGNARYQPYNNNLDQIYLRPDNSSPTSPSASALDLMAHEYTHAMIYRSSQLGSDKRSLEAASLNEGFCDIFGMLTERWVWGGADWTFGEKLGYQRNFNDPLNDIPVASPDYYGGLQWLIEGYGQKDPHRLSGPLRRWFNLLSQGEWNWLPAYSGIGLDRAESLSFITMTWNLWSGSDYNHAYAQTLYTADKHFGGRCGYVWIKVRQAWHNVGVGVNEQFERCRPMVFGDATVLSQDQIQLHKGFFKLRPNFDEEYYAANEFEVLNYDWIIPDGWEGSVVDNGAAYLLSSTENNDTKTIKVALTYSLLDTVRTDTFSKVVHICNNCDDENVENNQIVARTSQPASRMSDLQEVVVFPNPVSKNLNIIIPETMKSPLLSIYDYSGKTVATPQVHTGHNTIVLPSLPSGIYMLRIIDHKTNIVKRIQVQQ